jgi:hypothetical protein
MSEGIFEEPESKTVSVRTLMKNVRGAWRLLLPSFQRSFVWDEEDVKRFLESILLGYPTGTILLWKPSNPEVDPFALDMIDRVESATLKATTDGSEVYYVVDGQQRLTSLMLLINGWQLYRGGKPIAIHAITVNPSMELPKLYIDPSERRGVDLYRGIRDRFYTDTMESERLRRQLGRDAYDRLMQWIDKILDYNIPMYVIKTRHETPEILERMANIFIMVNRSGQKITNPELLLSYTAGIFDRELASQIRSFYDEYQRNFGEEVSITSYLRFAFSIPPLNLKQKEIDNVKAFKARVDEIRRQIDMRGRKVLYENISIAGKAYSLTLTLVNRVFGKAAIDLLPSHLSLIPVAAYLYRNRIEDLESLSVNDLEKIKRWLLLVNFNGYYSARTSPRLQKDLDSVYGSGSNTFPYDELLENIRKSKESAAVIDGADIQEGKFKDILKRPNKSYLFLLYTVLVDNDAEDWMGNSLRILQMKSLAKAHIFPREELGKRYLSSRLYSELYDEEERELEAKGVNGIGNITLMSREINSEISDDLPANYLKGFHKNILKQHFIPTREDLWNIERFEEFTEERTNLIKDFIKNRYPDIYHESS